MTISINQDQYFAVLFSIIIGIIVFLLMREIMCWYFKINHIKRLLEEANDQRETILKLMLEKRDKEKPNHSEKKS
ncbi:hypothetical protein C0580_02990 [Candidatus Parcubacteria bacterium]|nr:MAG: hypothetical protein C0580_02990 [Candidatus Parcubacteria bacterium]